MYLTSAQDGGDVMLSGNNAQPSSMWYLERLVDGSYKIESVWTHSMGVDYALQPTINLGINSVYNGSVNASSLLDEWFLIPVDGIYGTQTYRAAGLCSEFSNPSLAYALGLHSGDPDTFSKKNSVTRAYEDQTNSSVDNDEYFVKICDSFETWIEDNFEGSMSITKETDFSNNGANKTLQPNQFRIALRTGMVKHKVSFIDYQNIYGFIVDYHFWYQMYDGRWAHMKTTSNTVEMLSKGVIPTSETGWELNDYEFSYQINAATSNGDKYSSDFFFDSAVCVYIVTIEE